MRCFSRVPDNVYDFQEAFRRLKLSSGIYRNDTTGGDLNAPGSSGQRCVYPPMCRMASTLPEPICSRVACRLPKRELKLRVVKTGMEQAITNAAHQTPSSMVFSVC